MTQPTFQELLTSQEARSQANKFTPAEGKGSHWMSIHGVLSPTGKDPTHSMAIWQGWLTDCAPPPEPRVFKGVGYFNVLEGSGFSRIAYYDRQAADFASKEAQSKRLACVRVEITAIEGQWDD